jgi:hypothetical protein
MRASGEDCVNVCAADSERAIGSNTGLNSHCVQRTQARREAFLVRQLIQLIVTQAEAPKRTHGCTQQFARELALSLARPPHCDFRAVLDEQVIDRLAKKLSHCYVPSLAQALQCL